MQHLLEPISLVGNDTDDMLGYITALMEEKKKPKVSQIIISGGIKSFLDGYYFIRKSPIPAVYGQASMFLRYAREDYDTLRDFTLQQIRGLEIAYAYLTLRQE